MASLRAIGSSYADIARDLGVSRSAVVRCARRPEISARVSSAIAAKLGLHPADIWPERYVNDGDSTSSKRGGQ